MIQISKRDRFLLFGMGIVAFLELRDFKNATVLGILFSSIIMGSLFGYIVYLIVGRNENKNTEKE